MNPKSRVGARRTAVLVVAMMLLWLAIWLAWRSQKEQTIGTIYVADWPDGRTVLVQLMNQESERESTAELPMEKETAMLHACEKASGTWHFIAEVQDKPDSPGRLAGVFKEWRASADGRNATCTWRSANATNEVPLAFRRLGVMRQLEGQSGFMVRGYGGTKRFTIRFPQLDATTSFAQDAVDQTRGMMRVEQVEYLSEMTDHVWWGIRYRAGGPGCWSMEQGLGIRCATDRLISLNMFGYQYTGGAHGNYYWAGMNFMETNGHAQLLALKDLFQPERDWETNLSNLVLQELRHREASWVMDGSLTNLTADHMSSFVMQPGGLTIQFDPYAAGSYAEGAYFVEIPWVELAPWLKPNGPAKLVQPAGHLKP